MPQLLQLLDGKAGRLSFESGQTYYLGVEAFEPPYRFAYRWLSDKATRARPDNSMLVEFTLQAENGHTRLLQNLLLREDAQPAIDRLLRVGQATGAIAMDGTAK